MKDGISFRMKSQALLALQALQVTETEMAVNTICTRFSRQQEDTLLAQQVWEKLLAEFLSVDILRDYVLLAPADNHSKSKWCSGSLCTVCNCCAEYCGHRALSCNEALFKQISQTIKASYKEAETAWLKTMFELRKRFAVSALDWEIEELYDQAIKAYDTYRKLVARPEDQLGGWKTRNMTQADRNAYYGLAFSLLETPEANQPKPPIQPTLFETIITPALPKPKPARKTKTKWCTKDVLREVFILGNQLISQIGNRSMAFAQAWQVITAFQSTQVLPATCEENPHNTIIIGKKIKNSWG